jgi:hypothetical protein
MRGVADREAVRKGLGGCGERIEVGCVWSCSMTAHLV